MITKITKEINGIKYTLETGRLANQAQAAVLASAGETVVLSTVSVGPNNPDLDYFPLSIEYVEKLYAAGLISSSRFIKREGRPTEKEILSSRLLDHAIRSLFPEDLVCEVQVITQVLSYDKENSPELLQFISASAALCISGVPFKGPVAAVRVGLFDGKVKYFPTDSQMENSEMNLIVSIIDDAIVSIDADAHIVSEDILSNCLKDSLKEGKDLLNFQNEFVQAAGRKEFEYEPRIVPTDLVEKMSRDLYSEFEVAAFIKDKKERTELWNSKLNEMQEKYSEEYKSSDIAKCFDDLLKKVIREKAISEHKRIDGRKIDEVRQISAEINVLPRVHGSAIFNRGETQVMSVVTLGSAKMEQTVEGLEGEGTKRFMHHYNMPGLANGEIDRKFGITGRRSIGHGIIGEKSIEQVLPSENNFKYTVRVVSEVLSSNGSTSMAATCATSMALMQAGVKIEHAIGGISVGLIYENKDSYVLLTDIIGSEDHFGDMDFKITGNKEGWVAIQLDNKLQGIPVEILVEAISQSKKARIQILDYMNSVISAPVDDYSKYAPRITTIKINPSKIGELIGPGGKNIKEIIAQSGTEIDIEDDGSVNIAALTKDNLDMSIALIKQSINDIEVGSILPAVIKKVEAYGAFIEVSKGFGGLVHVSKMPQEWGGDFKSHLNVGQKVKVRFDGNDDQGRNNFSMKDIKD